MTDNWRSHRSQRRIRILLAILALGCAGSEDPVPDYASCELQSISDGSKESQQHYPGSRFTYYYDEEGRVAQTHYQPGGPGGWIQTHTWYSFEDDTLRSRHEEIENAGQKADYIYIYEHHRLSRIEFTKNDTITGFSTFTYNALNQITQVKTVSGALTASAYYTYIDGQPETVVDSTGSNTHIDSFEFDDKINPEALLGIYIADPIKSCPHNITKWQGVTNSIVMPPTYYTYKYDRSGRPIEKRSSSEQGEGPFYVYQYVCP